MRRSNSTVLAGRDEDLRSLGGALRVARRGRATVVVIDGPAGIGKSALLDEFLRRDGGSARLITARCGQLERDMAFAAAELLLDEPVAPTCSELEVGRRLLSRLGDPDHAGVTVLAVDDAHWMDRPSARALRFALRRVQVEPLLAVLVRRSGVAPHELFGAEDAGSMTVIRPAPLAGRDVVDLAAAMRGWNLAGEVVDRILERTGGSPLFVSTVLSEAASQTQLKTWRNVPTSVTEATARLLASLDLNARAVVEAAAVLAEPVDLPTLGGVAGVDGAAAGVDSAAAAGLMSIDRDVTVSCTHVLVQEAVYDGLPLRRRQVLHARAARWTSGDRRLGHRAAALSAPDPGLVAELVDAADAARRSVRYDMAATHRLRARSICGDPAQRDTLLLEALIDRVSAQDLDGADELAAQAEPLTPGPLRGLALGLLARERGRIGVAGTLLLEAIEGAPDRLLRHRAAVAAAAMHVRLNEGALALDVLAGATGIDDPELAGDAAGNRGIALWMTGMDGEALAQLDAAPASSAGSAWEADLLAVRGMVHLYAGDLPEALDALDRAVDLSHLWRPSTMGPRIHVMRAMARYHRGDWDGALVDAAAARALATKAEVWSSLWALGVSVDVPANRGQWDTAADHLAAAKAALAALPYEQVVDWVARHECTFHSAKGDTAALAGLLEPLISDQHFRQLAPFRSYRWILPAWIGTLVEVGQLADGDRQLARYAAMLDHSPGGLGPGQLGWLRGLLSQARGDPDAAREHFRAELADPVTVATPFFHGQVLHAAGRLEQAVGRRRPAIRYLTAAYQCFSGLRATPFVQRCRADLAASGIRRVGADPYSLTERQEDVAALVSRGYTNKEVARELFVSAKAVEYHLQGIFTKLGITSRQDLRRLWAAPKGPQ